MRVVADRVDEAAEPGLAQEERYRHRGERKHDDGFGDEPNRIAANPFNGLELRDPWHNVQGKQHGLAHAGEKDARAQGREEW